MANELYDALINAYQTKLAQSTPVVVGKAIAPGVQFEGKGDPWARLGANLGASFLGNALAGWGQASNKNASAQAGLKLGQMQADNPDPGKLYKALLTSNDPELQQLAPIVANQMAEQQQALNKMIQEKTLGYAIQGQYEPGIEAAKKAAQMRAEIGLLPSKIYTETAATQDAQNQIIPYGNDRTKAEDSLRTEIRMLPEVKVYQATLPLVKSMAQSFEKKTAAADKDFTFAVMNILDPGSIVREGEQLMIAKTGGVADQFKGVIQSLNGGAQLPDDVRLNLFGLAESRFNAYRDTANAKIADYKELGGLRGLNERALTIGYQDQPFMDIMKQYNVPYGVPGATPAPTPPSIPPSQALKMR